MDGIALIAALGAACALQSDCDCCLVPRASHLCLKIEQKCRSTVSPKVHNKGITPLGSMDELFTTADGIKPAYTRNGQHMKRNRQILTPRTRLSLGDLILAVSSCTSSNKETVATVADLLASGRVRLHDNGRFLRARVC